MPAAHSAKLSSNGNKIVLGVRPEDVRVVASPESDSSANGRVDVVEQLGAEQLAFTVVGDQNLLLHTNPDMVLAAGANVTLAFNVAKTHAFDPVSGAAYF